MSFPLVQVAYDLLRELEKLERICILKDYRKYGLGKVIIQALEEIAREKESTKSKNYTVKHRLKDFIKN